MLNFEKERNRERELYTERLNTFEKEFEENKQKLEEYERQKELLKQNEKQAEDEFLSDNYQIYDDYFEKNKIIISSEI